ncbi:porin, partial [Salmonella enterica subsp. enterica serovar Montevideo]|nr:porin [Salmonella enterica subsp. enterica serovar Montevideo]
MSDGTYVDGNTSSDAWGFGLKLGYDLKLGKVDGLRYFSDNAGDDGDQSYARIGFKGETQINDMLTGYGQW